MNLKKNSAQANEVSAEAFFQGHFRWEPLYNLDNA